MGTMWVGGPGLRPAVCEPARAELICERSTHSVGTFGAAALHEWMRRQRARRHTISVKHGIQTRVLPAVRASMFTAHMTLSKVHFKT